VQFLDARGASDGDGRTMPESDVPDLEEATSGGFGKGDDLPF
jgi:hypothetical protein